MSPAHFLSAVIILTALSGVDGSNGYLYARTDQCLYNPADLSDLVYIQSKWFNKDEFLRFNSTVGEWVGYTEHGVYNAKIYNNDPAIMAQLRGEKDRYCRQHVELYFQSILSKKAEPTVILRQGKPSNGGHPAMLVCSAYDFYPKAIKLTWIRDGKEQTGHSISSEELADGDWYYQIHSQLQFTPKSGEKISCMVEHISLKDPLEIVWDPSMPEAEKNKIAIGAAGLVLGFIVTAAGFIYYKTKARGRILVPTS